MIYNNYFHRHNCTIIALYILERPSAWSTSRIHPAWPLFRDELNLLLAFFHKCLPCLFWPTQYLACFNGSHFTLNPPFPAGQLNTSIQVNNTATPHCMYTDKHIYITFILLSIIFFTLLPFSWASWLAQTLPVWRTFIVMTILQLLWLTKAATYQSLKLSLLSIDGHNWRWIDIDSIDRYYRSILLVSFHRCYRSIGKRFLYFWSIVSTIDHKSLLWPMVIEPSVHTELIVSINRSNC
jgi:hypothetical protein